MRHTRYSHFSIPRFLNIDSSRYSKTWIFEDVFGRNEKREWGETIFFFFRQRGNSLFEGEKEEEDLEKLEKVVTCVKETVSFDSFIYSMVL